MVPGPSGGSRVLPPVYNSRVMAALRSGFVATFVLALAALTLMAPASVAACICSGPGPGGDIALGPDTVVFTGTVTDGTDLYTGERHEATGRLYRGIIYTFEVDKLTHGDPGKGWVFTTGSPGSCGRKFQLGATYLVHAHVVDPEAPYVGSVPTVPLATNECSGTEQLGPPNPLIAWTGLGYRGLSLAVTGLVLVAGVGVYFFRRRGSEVGQ